MAMPFADNSFDLVWSLESGEHMPDKRQFVAELARVCKPGGKIIIVAWCHRDLAPGEEALTRREEKLLRDAQSLAEEPRAAAVLRASLMRRSALEWCLRESRRAC